MSPLPTPSGARTQRGEDRRREILDVARELFSRDGYEQTSMAEVAARVGIVEGALYKHFASKRELLFEAMRAFYEPALGAVREHLQSIRGTRNRLRFVIAAQLLGFAKHPGLCRLIILDVRQSDDYQDSIVRKLNREMTSLVPEIIEEAVKAGELRGDIRATLVRDVIFGGIEHLAWKTLSGQKALDVQGEAEALTELIMQGLAPRAGADGTSASGRELDRLRAQVDRLEALVSGLPKPAGCASHAPAGNARVAAEDYALPAEIEAMLPEVCERSGVPAREHDLIRQLLSTPEAEWPACCRGDCSPCVDEHKAVARTILLTAAGRRS